MPDASTASSASSPSIDRKGGGFVITVPAATVISATNTPVKVAGTTSQVGDLLDVELEGDNRIVWRSRRRQLVLANVFAQVNNVGGNATILLSLFRNGVAIGEGNIEVPSENSNDFVSFAFPVLVGYGDYLEMYVGNQTNTNNVTLSDGGVSIYG